MECKPNNNFKIIVNAARDLIHVMPGIVVAKTVLSMGMSVISIINIQFLANIIDNASKIVQDLTYRNEFVKNVSAYIICYIMIQLSAVLLYYIDNILVVPKMEYFHLKLSKHLTVISLEATNEPHIQQMFWRAKDAVYQDRIMSVFMTVFNIIPILLQLSGTMIVLYKYNIGLVGLAFLSVFPSAVITYWAGKKEYKFSVEQTKNNRFYSYLWGIMTKKETVRENRIYGFSEYMKSIFFRIHRQTLTARKKLSLKEDMWQSLAEMLKNALYIAAVVFAVSLVYRNSITVGMFAACLGVFTTMQGRATQLFAYFSQVNSTCRFASDYYNFFELPKEDNGDVVLESNIDTIELRNISYKYFNKSEYALKGLNLTIKKGEFIVIVGENGSGKTTLSKIIMGLYKPKKGEVLVNGISLNDMIKRSYYDNFSIAIQNFEKYAITLRDNVAISRISSMHYDLDNVFHICDLEGIKERLGGYDAMLGIEFGDADLSGGEWQRIALARSMYRNSGIVILDEPTSAIDPLLEYELLNQFITLAKKHTCIVISHRVGLCKKADRIIVMHQGRVVEQGRHEELIANKNKYCELWESQARWYI